MNDTSQSQEKLINKELNLNNEFSETKQNFVDQTEDKDQSISNQDQNNEGINEHSTVKEIIYKLANVAIPTSLFFFLMIVHETISMIFINKKYANPVMIDALGIATFYVNCTYISIYYGLSASVDSLCSPAFTCKKYDLFKLYMGRAQIVGLITTIMLFFIHLFTIDNVLYFFSNSNDVFIYSRRYAKILLFSGLLDNLSAIAVRSFYIINQPIINAVMFLLLTPFHILYCFVFIVILDLNTEGAGFAFLCSRITLFIMTQIAVFKYNPYKHAYTFFGKQSWKLKGLIRHFIYSLGPMFLLISEWLAFELLNLIALQIDKFQKNAFTVHCVVVQISSLLNCLNFGMNTATSVLISKSLIKSKELVKRVVKASYVLGLSLIIPIAIILALLRKYILGLFISNNEQEMNLASPLILITGLNSILDMCQTMLSGFYRGIGLSARASIVTFCSFYLIMTSCSWILGVVCKNGIIGLWFSITIGLLFLFTTYLILLLFVDLDKQRDIIKSNMEKESAEHILQEILKEEGLKISDITSVDNNANQNLFEKL